MPSPAPAGSRTRWNTWPGKPNSRPNSRHTKRSGAGDLKGLTVGSYHNLVSFVTKRDTQWHQALNDHPPPYCCAIQSNLYKKIRKTLQKPYLQVDEVYLKALEDRSRCDQRTYHETNDCSAVDSEIKAFILRMRNEMENLCDNLARKKQYVRLRLTALHPKPPSSMLLFPGLSRGPKIIAHPAFIIHFYGVHCCLLPAGWVE